MWFVKGLRLLIDMLPLVSTLLKWKSDKKAEKMETALTAVIVGVESYTKTQGTTSDKIKAVIKTEAVKEKIEDYLNKMVIKITK